MCYYEVENEKIYVKIKFVFIKTYVNLYTNSMDQIEHFKYMFLIYEVCEFGTHFIIIISNNSWYDHTTFPVPFDKKLLIIL